MQFALKILTSNVVAPAQRDYGESNHQRDRGDQTDDKVLPEPVESSRDGCEGNRQFDEVRRTVAT
jgi:hypothetical protein